MTVTNGNVQLCWQIADETFTANPDARPIDVINKLVEMGVPYNTSRTQVAQYRRAAGLTNKANRDAQFKRVTAQGTQTRTGGQPTGQDPSHYGKYGAWD
ncbi:hypothetical protein ABFV67_11410 [Vibrio metschnikovii]|uniref:Uncharacterized protein n=1 Tax=bacterium 19PA01SH03 TaxID=2920705 RepID=A0AAU6SP28_UNCXX|nr:hypothetical protein [Vibrio metschnikovii]EKO3683600.1 hypothetical protein [Vibrio metschnikovii]EKO3739412.1 hypothetical protein [Vibrio metschnikovii]EKO3873007.1 hypothetical protein [Vibrio metschnikovii]EKO3882741.1 hypothetical protein [Vibrio metschnikovii]